MTMTPVHLLCVDRALWGERVQALYPAKRRSISGHKNRMTGGRGLLTLRSLLYIFFKDRPLIFTVFLTITLLSLLYCIAAPPVYRAQARLSVYLASPVDEYRPEGYRAPIDDRSRVVNDEIELLKGQYLTEQVVARLKRQDALPQADGSLGCRIAHSIEDRITRAQSLLNMAPGPLEPDRRMAADFRKSLSVSPVKGTNLVSIAFYWTDPRFAAVAANAYAEEYVTERNSVRDAHEAYRSNKDQAEVFANKLREAEGALQSFLTGATASEGSQQKDLILRRLADLGKRYERVALDLARMQGWTGKLRKAARSREGWIETPDWGGSLAGRHAYLSSLDNSYFALKGEREKLARLYSSDAVEVRAIDNQIANLRAQKIESLLAAAGVDLAVANEKKTALAGQIAEERKRLEDVGSAAATREQLEQQKDGFEKEYRFYKEKAEGLQRVADFDARPVAETKIADLAVPPLRPAFVRRDLILLCSGLAGLLLGFVFAAIHQSFRHTFRGARDVALMLNVPLLLTVPLTQAGPAETAGVEGKTKKGFDRLRKLFGTDLRRPAMTPGLMYGGAATVAICLVCLVWAGHLQRLWGAPPAPANMRADLETVYPQRLLEQVAALPTGAVALTFRDRGHAVLGGSAVVGRDETAKTTNGP